MRASTVELETKPHRSAPVGLRLAAPGRGPPACSPARPRPITGLSQARVTRLSPTTPTPPDRGA